MKIKPTEPPRAFEVGLHSKITIKDCGRIELDANEQITFLTPTGAEYDLVRKSWGFYATPSLNGRLANSGFRAALVKSPTERYYIFLMEKGKEKDFQRYLDDEKHTVVSWLDSTPDLSKLEDRLKAKN